MGVVLSSGTVVFAARSMRRSQDDETNQRGQKRERSHNLPSDKTRGSAICRRRGPIKHE